MSIERREHKRLAAHWRVAIQMPSTNEFLQGKTMDVSTSGACVLFDKNIPVGTSCLLYLEVPLPEKQTKKAISVNCKVMNTTLVGNISQFRVGFKFVSMDAATDALIKSKVG